MKFNNIEEVLAFIENRTNFGLGLIRVEEFLKESNIKNNGKIIHIGGTNGKGSVGFYLSNILINSGYQVGFFSSPSLEKHNDRIRINNENISDEDIISFINEYYDLIIEKNLTMFEIDTVLALDYFQKNQVDYLIIEVGMGGTYDGTNVVKPIISIITNVGLDHQQYLGESKKEIAYNKLGIVKENTPLITSEKDEAIIELMKEVCLEKNSELICCQKANVHSYYPLDFSYLNYHLTPKTFASYQVDNLSIVLEAINYLNNYYQAHINKEIVESVISNIIWPARFEIVMENPLVVIDGAHNIDGILALKNTLQHFDYHKTILFSALKDKETSKMISELLSISDDFYVSQFDYYRSASIEDLQNNSEIKAVLDYEKFIIDKIKDLKKDEMLIITGSLYFIAIIRKFIFKTFKNT